MYLTLFQIQKKQWNIFNSSSTLISMLPLQNAKTPKLSSPGVYRGVCVILILNKNALRTPPSKNTLPPCMFEDPDAISISKKKLSASVVSFYLDDGKLWYNYFSYLRTLGVYNKSVRIDPILHIFYLLCIVFKCPIIAEILGSHICFILAVQYKWSQNQPSCVNDMPDSRPRWEGLIYHQPSIIYATKAQLSMFTLWLKVYMLVYISIYWQQSCTGHPVSAGGE